MGQIGQVIGIFREDPVEVPRQISQFHGGLVEVLPGAVDFPGFHRRKVPQQGILGGQRIQVGQDLRDQIVPLRAHVAEGRAYEDLSFFPLHDDPPCLRITRARQE